MEKEYIYYWYDHLMLRGGCEILGIYLDADMVQDAIEKHDWDRFRLYRFLCDELDHFSMRDEKMTFFPDRITVYRGDDSIGDLPMTKETFMKITCSEYECG